MAAVEIFSYKGQRQLADITISCCMLVRLRLAVTFLEYWKRKNASIAYHWDCYDFEEAEVSSSAAVVVVIVVVVVFVVVVVVNGRFNVHMICNVVF